MSLTIFAKEDWPIYKGNIYFTGNNDEIIVKNNNLKWLFQAHSRVFNPIVSDKRVYFLDRKGFVYCVDEEYGKIIWKFNIRQYSSRFKRLSRSAGKIKYPLIKGNLLILTDPIAIYAFDKRTGRVLWARTAMSLNRSTDQSMYSRSRHYAYVSGIYSNPVIKGDKIIYGSRKVFMARNIRNGHMQWNNNTIKTFSGFPTFYDRLLFTQSMNYSSGMYEIYCMNSATGNVLWRVAVEKPFKIFSPVVYKKKLYIPSSKTMYCLSIKDGSLIWRKKYKKYITSHPSFTDRAILFTVDNSDIQVIDPKNGTIKKTLEIGKRSSPHYVTVRNQVYVARNYFKRIGGRKIAYGRVHALNFDTTGEIWSYTTPFPGAVSQPVAAKGILFIPAGNYLYAIGTQFYNRVVDGGSGYAVKPNKDGKKDPTHRYNKKNPGARGTKQIKIKVTDKNGKNIDAVVTVKKRKKGKIVYERKYYIKGKKKIRIPSGGGVEIITSKKGYLPKKTVIKRGDDNKKIVLDKIKRGSGFVVNNINFESEKWYLKKSSLDILNELYEMMRMNSSLRIEVRGFTDSLGTISYNQRLSERRSDSVRAYLIKRGISPLRIRSRGFGEKKPIASNRTAAGRKKNRRTEFFFLR